MSKTQKGWDHIKAKKRLPLFYKLISEQKPESEKKDLWISRIAHFSDSQLFGFLCIFMKTKIEFWALKSYKENPKIAEEEMEEFFKDISKIESLNIVEKEAIENLPKRWKEAVRRKPETSIENWGNEMVAFLCEGILGNSYDSIFNFLRND